MQHIKTSFSAFLLRHGYRYKSTVYESKTRNVHMATDVYKDAPVVVYEYRDRSSTMDSSRQLWQFLDHRHILRCMETFVGENGRDNIYITQHCSNGSVSEFIKSTKSTTLESAKYQLMSSEEKERLIRKWTMQCIKALIYTKALGLITWDFEWQDVLLDDNLDVKLATMSTFTHMGPHQTKPWRRFAGKCPEAMRSWSRADRDKMAHAEIFLVGTALLKIFKIAEDMDNRWNELAPKIASAQGISEDAKSFLTRVLEPKWYKRMIYSEALEHPWLKLAAPKNLPKKKVLFKKSNKVPAKPGAKSGLLGKLSQAKPKVTTVKDAALPSTSSQKDVEKGVIQEKPPEDAKGADTTTSKNAKSITVKPTSTSSKTTKATCAAATCKPDIGEGTREMKDEINTKLPEEKPKDNEELNNDQIKIPTKEHIKSDVTNQNEENSTPTPPVTNQTTENSTPTPPLTIQNTKNSASTPPHIIADDTLETPKPSEDTTIEEIKSSNIPSNRSSTNSEPKEAVQDEPQPIPAKLIQPPGNPIVLEEPSDTDINKSTSTLTVNHPLETNLTTDKTETVAQRPRRWSRERFDTPAHVEPWPKKK